MLVPDGGGRSGIGLKPFFCWDNTGYALGRDGKGNPERAAAMFAEFRKLHLAHREELAWDEGFAALCRFLERWDPARAEELPNWEEAAGQNVVFKLRGREGYVHQSEAVRSAWLRCITTPVEQGSGLRGISLVSGERGGDRPASPPDQRRGGREHDGCGHRLVQPGRLRELRQVPELQRPGRRARRVSLHHRAEPPARGQPAKGSHRRRDGRLLVRSRRGGRRRGDVQPVLRRPDCFQGRPAEHAATVDRVRSFLAAAAQGRLGDILKNPDAPFFILGLSPNASRLNVRYWLAGTVRQFAERLARHVEQLEMTGARPEDPPLTIRRLLLETAREPKDIAPQLAGEVARAVLAGLPYPAGAVQCGRPPHSGGFQHEPSPCRDLEGLSHPQLERGGARGSQQGPSRRGIPDSDGCSPRSRRPRRMRARRSSTARSRIDYFGAAGATPASVFPQAAAAPSASPEQAHQREACVINREKLRSAEICGQIDRFPAHLPLEKQGLFYIGYYHQRQDFFTKRTENDKGDDE